MSLSKNGHFTSSKSSQSIESVHFQPRQLSNLPFHVSTALQLRLCGIRVIGEKAFSVEEGETIHIGSSFAKVKIRPEYGYRDVENISKELSQKGVNRTVLNKEEALFLYVEGRAKKGFTAYLNKRAYHRELLSALDKKLNSHLVTFRKLWLLKITRIGAILTQQPL